MVKSQRIGTAFTALGLVGALAACASPGANRAHSASVASSQNVGVATRAQMALEQGDHVTAIDFAERAVDGTPRDAGFRALLGNAYFAGGRFASAEAAYRDSLALAPDQPQLVLKLALVAIAQGKHGEALAQLEAARGQLDPADYGLALALAGQPQMAVAVLDQAARNNGADARVRQNLALALALQGDWDSARTVAAQDVPADQLDSRIQQWMAFARPARASDQVAALTGVAPASIDPGQPARLALVPQQDATTRTAAADPVPVPVPATDYGRAPVEIAAASAPEPVDYAAVSAPAVEPVQLAAASASAPVVETIQPRPNRAASKAGPAPAKKSGAAGLVHKASFPKAALGNSKSVVQIGAYGSRGFVGVAWSNLAKKYPALRDYRPSSARFDSAKGTVYRLSVQGFASDAAARDFCEALQQAGGKCFVRTVAGDAPVRLAAL
jgi:D-alanyl-D-alanine carboxypeptidase